MVNRVTRMIRVQLAVVHIHSAAFENEIYHRGPGSKFISLAQNIKLNLSEPFPGLCF